MLKKRRKWDDGEKGFMGLGGKMVAELPNWNK